MKENIILDNEDYEKKSITLNLENGKQLVEPESLNFLNIKTLDPIYKIFTNMHGTNLGSNIVLECSEFQALWREEMSQINKTKTESINKIHIKMHELVAAPIISRRLIKLDNNLNIRSYVENNVSKSFMRQIDYSIFYGDGLTQPLGLLTNYEKNKMEKSIINVTLDKDELIGSLLNMEHSLAHIYKKNAFWIMSRNFHNLLQKTFYNNPNEYSSIINRDDINYRLFNRPLYVCDELDNPINKSKIHCILMNPISYTTIEDKSLKIIENDLDIDLKIIFIKYFGGTVTDSNGIIYGIYENNEKI